MRYLSMKNFRGLFRYLKDHRVIRRAIALILCIVTLFLITPPVIYSEALEAANYTPSEDGNQNTAESSNLANGYSYLKAVYEDTSKREEGVKHFRLEDGSYVAAQYPYPVHTLEDGEWKDIDNTLTEVSGGIYTTPSARIKFSKHITGNTEIFTLHDGNAKLRMSLLGANKKTTGKVISTGDTEGDDELGKMMNLEKLTSRLVYENVLDGVDLEYIVHSLNVKENIIVKEKRNSYSFSFGMSLNIARESRRANQQYAQKVIAATISSRNNTFASTAWGASFRFAAGTYISNGVTGKYSSLALFPNAPAWKPW